MLNTSDNKNPPTGTVDALCAALELAQGNSSAHQDPFSYLERVIKETDMEAWSNDKAVVRVETVQGQLIELCEFASNQEAADLMVDYIGHQLPVTITYKPIGARRHCFGMDTKEVEDRTLLLDVMLDNI